MEPNPNAYGVVATLTPSQATLGQGDSTQYVLQLTNTGSTDEQFTAQINGLPNGVYGNFSQYYLDVPPGASNFLDMSLTVSAAASTMPGVYPFSVTVTA